MWPRKAPWFTGTLVPDGGFAAELLMIKTCQMNVSVYIASRLQLKPDGGHRSPGVVIAISGIAVAVTVMILTLSVVTGFKNGIRDKVIGFDSELTVTALPATDEFGYADPATAMFHYDADLDKAIRLTVGDDVDIRPTMTATAVLKTDSAFLGLNLMAWDADTDYPFIERHMVEGTLPDYRADSTANQAVISRVAADELNLAIGDKVYTYFFTGGNMRTRRVTVAGIYDTMFGERDRMVAFCSMPLLRGVYSVDSLTVGGVMIAGMDLDRVSDASVDLQNMLLRKIYNGEMPKALEVSTVYNTGAVYFGWLDLLDTNVWVIIFLMTVVASFTLVSSLFILILERVRMIGLLKSLGATNMQVRRIFLFLAMKIVIWGMVAGNLLAVALILIQMKWHIIPLDPESYYLSYVPTEFNLFHLVAVDVATLVVSWLVMVFPSMIISTISPARSMRYE